MSTDPNHEHGSVPHDDIEPAVEAAKKVIGLSQQGDSSERIREQLIERARTTWDAFAKQGEDVEDVDESKSYVANSGVANGSSFDVRSGQGGIVVERRIRDVPSAAQAVDPPKRRGTAYVFRNDGEIWADDWRPDTRSGFPPHQPYPTGSQGGLRKTPESRPVSDEELAFLETVPATLQTEE